MDYKAIAYQAAVRHGFEPSVFVPQMAHESGGWNPRARSNKGAQGIAQIMPATAEAWKVDPWDPVAALDAAAKNMAQYKRDCLKAGYNLTQSHKRSLAMYNAGPTVVSDYTHGTNKSGLNPHHLKTALGIPPFRETQNYIKIIMKGV